MNHPLGLLDDEVVHELAVRADRLGPHAGAGPDEVRQPHLRHQPPQRPPERPLAQRSVQLAEPGPPEPRGHPPEPAVAGQLPQVAAAHVGQPVALAAERQHGVRPALDAAADHPREVDAQERQPRVGDRVDEVAAEVLRGRGQALQKLFERHAA